jgi:predicted N-acetyltransferase YhbS
VGDRWIVRAATPADADGCGRVIHEAFGAVNARHGFVTRWPSVEFAVEFTRDFLALDGIYGVVCERAGRVVGCNFLDERADVCGVGPTAVAPSEQGTGVGRALMMDVLSQARPARGVRLLQDAFNPSSLSLYVSLGFKVKEPIALLRGAPSDPVPEAHTVRPIQVADLDECSELCRAVHGFDRCAELSDALRLRPGSSLLVASDGSIVAYTSGFGTFGHAVAKSEAGLRALICAGRAPGGDELEFLLPQRHAGLFRWCLGQGMTVVKQMTLMAIGDYAEPRGSWLPSVLL